jgi:hypothetical protein
MNFSDYLAVPFFTPYMLNDLNLGYLTFALVNAASIIVKIFSVPVWGKGQTVSQRKGCSA